MILSNEKRETQPTLINLHPNEYSQELHYYPFVNKSDRCVGSCNTLNDLSNKVCVPNKTDLNIRFFNMIAGKNESKVLIKGISWECKCKFDGRICNSYQKWNNDKFRCECKKHLICEKDYIWNPATCSREDGKYLPSIIHDSVITCDEIMEEAKIIQTNLIKKQPVKH